MREKIFKLISVIIITISFWQQGGRAERDFLRPLASKEGNRSIDGQRPTFDQARETTAAKRNIYETEFVAQVQQIFSNLPISADARELVTIRPSIVYRTARAVERGKLDTASIEEVFLRAIHDSLEEMSQAGEPNAAEQNIVDEAAQIVKTYCLRHGIPFKDFSQDVFFYTPSSEKVISGVHQNFLRTILIPDNVTQDIQLRIMLHEAFEYISGGFPIGLIHEGATEYLAIMAYLEYYNISPGIPEINLETGQVFQLLSSYTEHGGAASKYMLQRMIEAPQETGSLYFPQVCLFEYLVDRVLPVRTVTLEEFLHAYINGDMPFLITLLGEDTISELEIVDASYGKEISPEFKPSELVGKWLFLLEMGKAVLTTDKPVASRQSSEDIGATESSRNI